MPVDTPVQARSPFGLTLPLYLPFSNNRQEVLRIMDWVPIVFIVFKLLVFGMCMFFAIKWHYDQGKKK